MFRVGQKVVCIKRGEWTDVSDEIVPRYGFVYTIRAIDCAIWLRFEEIINEPQRYMDGFGEKGFHASRFRPAKTTDTGMAVLNSLLLPTPKKKRIKEPAGRALTDLTVPPGTLASYRGTKDAKQNCPDWLEGLQPFCLRARERDDVRLGNSPRHVGEHDRGAATCGTNHMSGATN